LESWRVGEMVVMRGHGRWRREGEGAREGGAGGRVGA
jgi:hypothetical protein